METATPDTLRRIPLFADLAEDELVALATRTGEFAAPAGHVLIEIGQPGSGLFVVEEGEVEVEMPSGDSRRLGPGEFVGEIALLTDAPRNARVRAATDVRCLAISRGDFATLLEEQPRVAVAMLPVLARRLATMI